MKKATLIAEMAIIAVTGIFSHQLFAQVSQTPPMGWASYDCLNFSATEAEMKAMADTMAKKYASYGWLYINIDWCWSFPCPGITNCTQGSPNQTWVNGIDGNPDAATRLKMDAYGRLMPDTVRHPSAVGGAGFKPLADYIHGKGLKFGIHVMRGIPRQAVYANTPIYGTTYHAADAANKNENCAWLNHMYGLNFGSPAAQAYLNSILTMYAAWGIDYIKIDDLVNSNVSPRTTFKTYIQGYRAAIDSTHRPIVFSTSPGATPIGDSVFFMTYVNQWRMADDLWDNWSTLNTMLDLFANWYHCAYSPHFPDADMIPIGYLSERGPNGGVRYSNFTRAEQFTLMTMWCIGRSPLLWGGDLRNNRLAEDSLMTNAEVIAVNQRGLHPRPVVVSANYPIWVSDHPDSSNVKYIAMVNRTTTNPATMTLTLSSIGFTTCTARNLWTKTNLGSFTTTFGQSLATHASGLYKLTAPVSSVAGHGVQGIRLSVGMERRYVVAGGRFIVPSDYAGTAPMLYIYNISGKLISAMVAKDRIVDLRKKCGVSEGVYIVRIR
jgi:hypothetical protein